MLLLAFLRLAASSFRCSDRRARLHPPHSAAGFGGNIPKAEADSKEESDKSSDSKKDEGGSSSEKSGKGGKKGKGSGGENESDPVITLAIGTLALYAGYVMLSQRGPRGTEISWQEFRNTYLATGMVDRYVPCNCCG